jgi:hypothetical protein
MFEDTAVDERMHDRERPSDHGELRDRERDRSDQTGRPQYGGGWHRGTDYGPRGGYGRYDDRTEVDRERLRARDEGERLNERTRLDDRERLNERDWRDDRGGERGYAGGSDDRRDDRGYGRVERRYDRDAGDRSARGSSGRYDYADEGYGGAYRRDRDDQWRGAADSGDRDNRWRARDTDDRSGYDRQGEAWHRDAESRRPRDANWGAAFDPGEHRRDADGHGYDRDRQRFARDGRPSDHDDERGGRFDDRRFEQRRDDAGRHDEWRSDGRRQDERRQGDWRSDDRRYDERYGDEPRGRFDYDRDDRWRSESRDRRR